MILDSLDQVASYYPLHRRLRAAFEWLERHSVNAESGHHKVDEGVIAIVNEYRTAPAWEKKWETHRCHLDLQVVLSGSELVGWSAASELVTRVPYNHEKDAEFYEAPVSETTRFRLEPGLFAIFFPADGHQPGIINVQSEEVRKVVFKLKI